MSPVTLAKTLTYLGTFPFIYGGFGAIGLAPLSHLISFDIKVAMIGYAAVILSFIAGIHWGVALNKIELNSESNLAFKLLLMSNVMALWAWLMWLWPTPENSALGLAVGFILILILDWRWLHLPERKPWFWRLRWQATSLAIVSLVLTGVNQ